MRQHFTVTADHVVPRYRFTNHPAKASPSPGLPGKWFATSDGLGCSKDYTTPESAVRSLFTDNACTNVRLRPLDTTT